jgi:ABC-type multidrug transport system fused ATPase/permease subunit
MMQRADESLWGSGDGSAIEQMVQGGTKLITSALGYILFGAVLSFASPWIVLILTIMPIVDYFLIQGIQKYQYASKGETSSLDRKLWYIATKAGDYKAAKDIRIYSISTWLIGLYKRITKERLGWDKKYAARYFLADILHGIMILFRDSGAYIILISMVLNDNISIDEFVMYFAAVSGFANWVGGIISELTKMSAINLNACDLRDFLSCREKNNRGTGCVLPDPTKPCAIKLEDVCFQYEGADKNTINHISLDIHAGEKVAIVGLNGTGKTTLIKLLCGLYTPDTGDIYINEKNKNEYNIYEYYSLFSTVFQDHHFLPISLARIVSCAQDGEVDGQKVYECLSISGFRDKIDSLRDGLGTRLNKQINNDAVELSGGEEQKLLLARALYKDARILILDEPTASLDPIAESNLYLQYKDMCTNKTAIFISHRLASTKFCDRILFMENGEIAETGAHDELLRQGGKYAAMFETQSQYYTEQKEVLK